MHWSTTDWNNRKIKVHYELKIYYTVKWVQYHFPDLQIIPNTNYNPITFSNNYRQLQNLTSRKYFMIHMRPTHTHTHTHIPKSFQKLCEWNNRQHHMHIYFIDNNGNNFYKSNIFVCMWKFCKQSRIPRDNQNIILI